MNKEVQRREQEHFTALAYEMADKFRAGLLKELAPYPQFIVWKYQEAEKGKKKKPPYDPRTHRPASPTDPNTWGTRKEALKALTTGLYHGIGFVFTESTPFMGIDLDHCVHNNRRIDYRPAVITSHFNSYTEYSPNDGLHIIIKAKAPFTTRRLKDAELFNSGHTLSLTLRQVAGTPAAIEDRQKELDEFLAYFDTERVREPGSTPSVIWRQETQPITEVEKGLIQHWRGEPGNFARYFDGDRRLWLGSGRQRETKSEADFVLCLMLLTRTNDDTEAVKRIFRVSGLYDPDKTDRVSGHDPASGRPVTYLEMTIFNALKKRPESPNRKRTG